MAVAGVTPEAALGRSVPLAARVAIVYVAARLVTTGLLALAAALSGPGHRFGAHADIGSFVLGWDAQWYWLIAVHGYPVELPLTDSGAVAENAWAFMPLYPWLANLVGAPFGSWGAGALVISVVAGYLACLALARLLRPRIGSAATMWAVAFFACGPLAAMFQVGYAETLFLLFLLLALGEVMRRRYGWLYVLVPLMGFTRPGVLAFALFLGLYGIWRLLRRAVERIRTSEVVHVVALGLLSAIVGFAWQAIAAVVTGDPEAYLQTELAWRRNWIADAGDQFFPFDGALQAGRLWFGVWGMPEWLGWTIAAIVAAGIVLALVLAPPVRRLGMEVRLWSASYLVYLAAVFFPQSSLFRLLLPLAPLWGAVAVPPSRLWRVGVLVACLVGQWFWILNAYGWGDTFWRIP